MFPSICLSIYRSIDPSICLLIHLPIGSLSSYRPAVYLSVCPSVCRSIYLSTYLSKRYLGLFFNVCMRSSLNSFSQTRTKITFTAYLQDSAFKVQVFQQASIMTWRKLCMINLGQHVAKVASGRLFWLELLGLLESRTCPASPVLLTNKVDSMTPWPISQLLLPAVYHVPIFEASSALGFSSAVSWPLGNSVFLDVSSVDLPWKTIVFTYLHKSR